jgi:hypothetical protein
VTNHQQWLNLQFSYKPGDRPELIEAVSQTVAAYTNGDTCIGHMLPPRAGKSTVIRASGIELKAAGAPFVHLLTPWKNLAKQIHDEAKVEAQLATAPYDWDGPYKPYTLSIINKSTYWKTKKETTLISSTIHLVHKNKDVVVSAVEACIEQGLGRPVFAVDEAHLVGEVSMWWETVEALMTAGAFVVALTGTPGRVDGRLIPGFTAVPLTEKQTKTHTRIKKRGDVYLNKQKQLVRLCTKVDEVYARAEVEFRARGVSVDFVTAFQRGWLQSCEPVPVEFDVRDPETDQIVPLSSVPEGVAQTHLGRWLRSSECCRATAKVAAEQLNLWRKVHPDAKMLVITTFDTQANSEGGSDFQEDTNACNAHAREFRRAFMDAVVELQGDLGSNCVLRLEDLSMEICTSKLDNGEIDDTTTNKLLRFGLTRTDTAGNAPIDVLVVKNMGVVGLDVPECKVMVDLSQIRRGPVKAQLAFRPLTVWEVEGYKECRYYLPARRHEP